MMSVMSIFRQCLICCGSGIHHHPLCHLQKSGGKGKCTCVPAPCPACAWWERIDWLAWSLLVGGMLAVIWVALRGH